jgi:hypothetical protein
MVLSSTKILCRRGGSWGKWHVVGDDSIPVCGSTSRLGTDVVSVPPGIEQRIREGTQSGVCGNCLRRIAKAVGSHA